MSQNELEHRMQQLGFRDISKHGVGAYTSWIRIFNKELQQRLVKKPTLSKTVNHLLRRLDADTTSVVNRLFGREIMIIGYK